MKNKIVMFVKHRVLRLRLFLSPKFAKAYDEKKEAEIREDDAQWEAFHALQEAEEEERWKQWTEANQENWEQEYDERRFTPRHRYPLIDDEFDEE